MWDVILSDPITIPALTLEQQGAMARALGTWVEPLQDFYKMMIEANVPADLANGLVISFWEQTLAAGYAVPDYDD